MGKVNKVNLASLIKDGMIGLGLIFGIFFVFFEVPLSVIKNENILNIYIPSLISIILLLLVLWIFYYSYIAYKNNNPKHIDGKYVWKDGRIYEGDWDKKHGANGKGKLTWSDGFYYEGEFKDGKPHGKGKREENGTVLEGNRVDGYLEGKGKLIGSDGGIYEGEFKKGKPDGMGIIKMKNGYFYEGEFNNGKRTGRFRKQVLITGGVIEGEFRDNGKDGFDGTGKVITSNGFTFEGLFKDGELDGQGKIIFPDGSVCIGDYINGKLKNGKKILKSGEYSEGDWVNGELNGLARYYFKDGSYYEGECKQGNWDGIGTYVTKKGDKYPTEFPYEIINIFMYGLNSKIKEIQGVLNYIPKGEQEKMDENNMYLEILKKGTGIQKEIVKLSLEEDEKAKAFLKSLKDDGSLGNTLEFHRSMLELYEENRKKIKKIADKNHIKYSKSVSVNSYGKYFYDLDYSYGMAINISEFFIKFDEFLDSKNILDFITKREEKNKERVILIDEFSDKYREYVQICLDWRKYEKKFWKHNFKSGKGKR